MADSKLTALAEITAPTGEDLIYIVDDPSGTPASKKISLTLLGVLASAPNLIINGGFWFAQRQTPTTSTTISDQSYSADRWRCYRESADVQYRRYKRADSGSDFTGITSECYGRFTKITNGTKFLVCQPIEAAHCWPYVGRTVTFQVKLRSNTSRTIQIGIIEWTGTADTLTAAMVTAWGASTVNPTLATSYSLAASASCSVTTSFQTFYVSYTVGSSAKNLVPVIFSDSGVAANDYVEIAEADLHDGTIVRPWLPGGCVTEIHRAQRYYYKTYNIDTIPATTFTITTPQPFYSTNMATNGYQGYGVLFPVPMRSAPTITPYDSAGNSGKASYFDGAWKDNGVVTTSITQSGFGMVLNGASTPGSAINAHFTASAEL